MRTATCAAIVAAVILCFSHIEAGEPESRPFIVAHRGLLRHAPENTLANFRACLELRLGFELDVERSRDGQLVCIHDSTVDRTTDGRGKVSELTLAELKRLDAGSWFDPRFAGERIPTIEEVFALIAAHPKAAVLIAVDLKAADANLERDVVALAAKHKILDRLLFIGRAIGDAGVRERLRSAASAAHVARVANNPREFPAAIADAGADWVYFRYVPTSEEIERVHAAKKWTFIAGASVAGRETANWQSAAGVQIDAILTDYPLELRRTLNAGRAED